MASNSPDIENLRRVVIMPSENTHPSFYPQMKEIGLVGNAAAVPCKCASDCSDATVIAGSTDR
jgi:hypothetical protein